MHSARISIVIPTYGREKVLTDTVAFLLDQRPPAGEILIMDQTQRHEPSTAEQLRTWHRLGDIRWIRLEMPSITRAMNQGLLEARFPVVLFLDDDILPAGDLLKFHLEPFADSSIWAVAGQVLQPGQEPEDIDYQNGGKGIRGYLDFPFHTTRPGYVENVMAGNLAVRRDRAVEIGGFDENFVGVAYRFETEFARRLVGCGGRIYFQPKASIHHLRKSVGGTRTHGSHLTSASPMHGVGDYYFALKQNMSAATVLYMLGRPFREICTRFHLRHPWWIPVKLVGELRAMAHAIKLWQAGPGLITGQGRHDRALIKEK